MISSIRGENCATAFHRLIRFLFFLLVSLHIYFFVVTSNCLREMILRFLLHQNFSLTFFSSHSFVHEMKSIRTGFNARCSMVNKTQFECDPLPYQCHRGAIGAAQFNESLCPHKSTWHEIFSLFLRFFSVSLYHFVHFDYFFLLFVVLSTTFSRSSAKNESHDEWKKKSWKAKQKAHCRTNSDNGRRKGTRNEWEQMKWKRRHPWNVIWIETFYWRYYSHSDFTYHSSQHSEQNKGELQQLEIGSSIDVASLLSTHRHEHIGNFLSIDCRMKQDGLTWMRNHVSAIEISRLHKVHFGCFRMACFCGCLLCEFVRTFVVVVMNEVTIFSVFTCQNGVKRN